MFFQNHFYFAITISYANLKDK